MHRIEWSDGGVEFHLAHGDMLRLLRDTGFEIEDLIELFAPESAETHPYYSYVTAGWARKWPSEEIWAARKPA
jgi:anti-sigma regulatory factor (Ser/Thr protein kinase)